MQCPGCKTEWHPFTCPSCGHEVVTPSSDPSGDRTGGPHARSTDPETSLEAAWRADAVWDEACWIMIDTFFAGLAMGATDLTRREAGISAFVLNIGHPPVFEEGSNDGAKYNTFVRCITDLKRFGYLRQVKTLKTHKRLAERGEADFPPGLEPEEFFEKDEKLVVGGTRNGQQRLALTGDGVRAWQAGEDSMNAEWDRRDDEYGERWVAEGNKPKRRRRRLPKPTGEEPNDDQPQDLPGPPGPDDDVH